MEVVLYEVVLVEVMLLLVLSLMVLVEKVEVLMIRHCTSSYVTQSQGFS